MARIIAFSLVALDSLSLSMRDDLPIALILRLRVNANVLNRSAKRAERALAEAPYPSAAADPPEPFDEAAIHAGVAEAQARAAAARASLQDQEISPQPAPGRNRHRRSRRLRRAHARAAEPRSLGVPPWRTSPPNSPARPGTSRRPNAARQRCAQILSTAAVNLLYGAWVPPRPGDPAGMMPPPRC